MHKGEVDSIDQMCHSYSCSQPTKIWPLAVSYDIINSIGINYHTIYNKNAISQGGTKSTKRRFLYNLAMHLIFLYLRLKSQVFNIRSVVKIKINDLMQHCQEMHNVPTRRNSNEDEEVQSHSSSSGQMPVPVREDDGSFAKKTDNKQRVRCHACNVFLCEKHRLVVCSISIYVVPVVRVYDKKLS